MPSAEKRCILCLETIASPTKPEHILLNALGGRVAVRDIVCSACNERMGRGPDQDLADSLAVIRNVGHLLSGDGGSPPTIHGMASKGMTFDLAPGMRVKPRHEGKKIKVNKDDDHIEIRISTTSPKEIEALITGAARAVAKDLGHSDPRVIAGIRADLLANHKRSDDIAPAPPITGEIQFGTGRSQQSMAKAALVLWARLVGNEEVNQRRYDSIRNFILNGVEPPEHEPIAKIDYRRLPATPERYGSNPNIIEVSSDGTGTVHGYFRLYGAIGWRFLLCASGGPPDRTCALISNPFQHEIFDLTNSDESILSQAWISAEWDLDLADMTPVTQQIGYLIAHGQEQARDLMIRNLIREAFELSGCKEGDYLTEDQSKFVADYVSKFLTAYLMKKSESP